MSVAFNPFNPQSMNTISRVAQGLASFKGFSMLMNQQPQQNWFPQKNKMAGGKYVLKRTYKRKPKATAMKKVATVGAVKRMIKNSQELKILGYKVESTALNATVGSFYGTNLTAQIAQGNADGNRIGDEVYLESLEFGLWFAASTTANDTYILRVLIVWSGEEYNPTAGTFSDSILTAGDIFVANRPASGPLTGVCNPKGVTVVFDRTYTLHSLVSGVAIAETARGFASLKKKFKYQSAASAFGKSSNLYLLAIPANRTSNAANDVDVQFHMTMKFRDA